MGVILALLCPWLLSKLFSPSRLASAFQQTPYGMGQRQSRQEHGQSATLRASNPIISNSHSASMSLYDTLDGKLKDCPISEKEYLPLGVLDDLITPQRVLASLNTPVEGQSITSHHCYDIEFATNVVKHARKLFTVLVFIGQQHTIESLLSTGLTDQDLPLHRRASPDLPPFERTSSDLTLGRVKSSSLTLESGVHDKKTFAIFEQWKPHVVGQFISKQWLVLAPVFESSGGHFTLTGECALPLLSPPSGSQDTGCSRNNEVTECLLHPDHYCPESSVNIFSPKSISSAY
jgi:hypothetical protein